LAHNFADPTVHAIDPERCPAIIIEVGQPPAVGVVAVFGGHVELERSGGVGTTRPVQNVTAWQRNNLKPPRILKYHETSGRGGRAALSLALWEPVLIFVVFVGE
jgi:hypothetical protein